MYLPTYSRYAFLGPMKIEGREAVLALASRLGIPVVDVHEAFKALEDPQKMWVHPRGHLGSQGYAAPSQRRFSRPYRDRGSNSTAPEAAWGAIPPRFRVRTPGGNRSSNCRLSPRARR